MKHYIGIDLGGTNIVIGIVDESYKIVYKNSIKTKKNSSSEIIINDIVDITLSAINAMNFTMKNIEWIGIGAPGTANKETGIIEYSNNLNWINVPIVEMINKKMTCPVFIENDANAAAYGEYMAGCAKNASISVMVTLGTGVGGGVVINNKIYTGFNFAGGELGHTVMMFEGRECTCGRKGCFEAYGSATGLITTTKEIMKENENSLMWKMCNGDLSLVSGRTSFNAMRQGDKAAEEVVKKYISHLACGITNILNIFQPDLLCIGGGISHEGNYLLTPLKKEILTEVFSRRSKNNSMITIASLGNDAGLIGAALLGLSN